MSQHKPHVGQRIRALEVMEILPKSRAIYKCLWLHGGTPCGNTFIAINAYVFNGQRTSCGCYRRSDHKYKMDDNEASIHALAYRKQWVRRNFIKVGAA